MDRKIMFCWAMVVTMRVSDGEARGRRGMGTWKVTKSMLEYTVVLYELFSLDSRKECTKVHSTRNLRRLKTARWLAQSSRATTRMRAYAPRISAQQRVATIPLRRLVSSRPRRCCSTTSRTEAQASGRSWMVTSAMRPTLSIRILAG